MLELAHIALNKNTVPGDKSAMVPGGIRMGAPAMTTRGLVEKDFEQVADFVHRGVQIAKQLKDESGARCVRVTVCTCSCVQKPLSAMAGSGVCAHESAWFPALA